MNLFPAVCTAAGLPRPVPELRFAAPRRWRFDWAWPDLLIALEVQGGLFVNGRHSRGPALLKEHEKLNAAAVAGWRILYCTPATLLTEGPELVRQAIGRHPLADVKAPGRPRKLVETRRNASTLT